VVAVAKAAAACIAAAFIDFDEARRERERMELECAEASQRRDMASKLDTRWTWYIISVFRTIILMYLQAKLVR
jgi:hypothetical protein